MPSEHRLERFFIVGCGRSGTTLLKSILSAHPDIYVCQETFFFNSVLPRLRENPGAPEKVANAWWLADAGLTPDVLRPRIDNRLAEGLPPECATFAAILDFHAERHPGQIIGEKTPDHVNYIDAIRRCSPRAKFIQVVRDPRAVLASYRKVQIGSNAVANIATEWSKAAAALETWRDQEWYASIRYEDLVTDPETVLRRICIFLDLDWRPEMLEFHTREAANYAVEQLHHANTRRALFRESLDAWRAELSKHDVTLLEWALGETMARLGYQPSGTPILFAWARIRISRLHGFLHKALVLYPRQKLKARRVLQRLSQEKTKK